MRLEDTEDKIDLKTLSIGIKYEKFQRIDLNDTSLGITRKLQKRVCTVRLSARDWPVNLALKV